MTRARCFITEDIVRLSHNCDYMLNNRADETIFLSMIPEYHKHKKEKSDKNVRELLAGILITPRLDLKFGSSLLDFTFHSSPLPPPHR